MHSSKLKITTKKGMGESNGAFYLYTSNRHLESIRCWQKFMFQNYQNPKISKVYTIHFSKPQLGKIHH
jgi:hypothetical protein